MIYIFSGLFYLILYTFSDLFCIILYIFSDLNYNPQADTP